METKVQHTRESICRLLDTNQRAVERAIVFLYNEQTESEKVTRSTQVHNNRGFNHAHARYGSFCARWILDGNSLTGGHVDKCRRIAKVYVRQLVERANRAD